MWRERRITLLIKKARLVKELTEGIGFEGLGDVLIHGNRIKEISPTGTRNYNEDEVLDINGNTLLPGLWDLHAHLYLQSQTCNTDVLTKDVGDELFDCFDYAKEYLKQGYTTIRDCGSILDTNILLRNAINRGALKGPRIIACGIIITPTERGNSSFPRLYAEVDGVDELMKVARLELQKGADFLKYMATGAYTNSDGRPGDTIATIGELRAIQEIAEMKNTYVAVHAHGDDGIRKCVDVGIRTIEHGSLISDETIDKMLAQNEPRSFIIPTLSLWDTMLSENPQGLVTNGSQKLDLVRYSMTRWEQAYKAGLKLGFGTDITMPEFVNQPGLEFKCRKNYTNMKDIDLLLQATKYSAEIAGYSDELGTVKEGKIADLIVVEGKPDDDISAMYKLPTVVIRDGEKLI